ncbi:MAG TPA: hypothetical protein VFW23_04895 [Tepidisphaeraceae bacterium]|nr:hypothetical protein [Tepidisphaeraceae bacterium]
MRALLILLAILIATGGLVAGTIAIGWSRLHRQALPAQVTAVDPQARQAMPQVGTLTESTSAGAPTTAPATRPTVQQNSAPPQGPSQPTDGSILLTPATARIHGYKLRRAGHTDPIITGWSDSQEYVEWPLACPKAARYEVEVSYSCAPHAGGEFAIHAGSSFARAKTENTGDWQSFTTVKLGTLDVINDNTTLSLRSTGEIRHALMNLKSVRLIPISDAAANAPK